MNKNCQVNRSTKNTIKYERYKEREREFLPKERGKNI